MTALLPSLPLANQTLIIVGLSIGGLVALFVVMAMTYAALYRKVKKGTALIRTGFGGTKIEFNGILVWPVFHRVETMDISLKRIEIDRTGNNGLICQDNMRADIKVAFFVRVNNVEEDVLRVAQSVGCERASSEPEIRNLFDAKFSEALKTVGKRFDFIALYEDRDKFRDEILKVIGTDLNGFVLDDAAIDYLEQTPLESLDPDNILDSEGIKKITDLTAEQAKLANNIQRDKEKVIKQQDVEAREAILELERQLAETEAKQQREVETVQAREKAEALKVQEEQRQKAEHARIAAEEEIQVASQNQERQVLVAQRNKERTDGVELERVERERMLEQIERERVTELKAIEKEKAVEVQKKEIQDVIRERVAVEKTVVEEQQRIKDTEEFATADRQKQVTVTLAEASAQEKLITEVKEAEASKQAVQLEADQKAYEVLKAAEAARQAAEMEAEERVITAEAEETASEKEAAAKKLIADAVAKEAAAVGLGEADVLRAKGEADAQAITQKAEAMKLFEEAGQGHEEFKLKLEKDLDVELAEIDVQRQIAEQQAQVVGEALKSANIDIVGGETEFFDRITNAITTGKVVDRTLNNSEVLEDVKDTFFNGDPDYFKSQLASWLGDFGVKSEDLKNLSVTALLASLVSKARGEDRTRLVGLMGAAERFGLGEARAADLLEKLG
ncbi:MAG: flotillin [Roseibacillus sp.]|nr:flotillin [Roseibacillus sp.]